MSDATPKTSAPAKAAKTEKAAPKTETAKTETAKSETTKSGTAASSDGGSSDSAASSSAPAEKAISGKASMGGADAVHYGFFSNVKTPQYRSGWDSIWSKDKKSKKSSAEAPEDKTSKASPRRTIRPKAPVEISLGLDDLPADVRDALIAAARVKLRGSRVNYDRREKAGAVSWTIACEVKR